MTLRAKTPAAPTVGAGLAKGLLDLAVSRGAPRDGLLERAGLTEADLDNQDARVPFAKYAALMRAGQDLARDPALALHFGETINLSDMSIIGNVQTGPPTLEEAVSFLNRYGRLLIELDEFAGDAFSLVRENGETWLVDNRVAPGGFHELTESTFARVVCWTRRLSAPSRAFVQAVEVKYARPAYASEYERVLRVPVRFGGGRNALLIDESWKPQIDAAPSRYVSNVLAKRADELLENLANASSVRGRVEAALIPSLRTGQADLACVAKALGLSRKTLYRKLKAEGTSYAEVLDGVRRRTAIHCLNSEGASINDTAYLLGFSDTSAFSRAFKRWTGKSPRDWQKRN